MTRRPIGRPRGAAWLPPTVRAGGHGPPAARARLPLVLALTGAFLAAAALPTVAAPRSGGGPEPAAGPAAKPPAAAPGGAPSAVDPGRRTDILGPGYRSSKDVAWTTSGDAAGFHVLVADEKDGYRWRTAATLSEPGFDADSWIGNACVSASGRTAAVAYAPRTFTNKPELMSRGAFTATVDLTTGAVVKLPFQATLGYFSPGCGDGDNAVFSQLTDDKDTKNATRLISVDTRRSKAAAPVEVTGEVTSAVPTSEGVVAAQGRSLIRIDAAGARRRIAGTRGVPFELRVDADGGVVYLEQDTARPAGPTASRTTATGQVRPASAQPPKGLVERVDAAQIRRADGKGTPALLATAGFSDLDLQSSATGQVFVTGAASTVGQLPRTVRNPGGLSRDVRISTRGQAAVDARWADGQAAQAPSDDHLAARTARIHLTALDTGKSVDLAAQPDAETVGTETDAAAGTGTSPALRRSSSPGSAAAAPTTRSTGTQTTGVVHPSTIDPNPPGSATDPVEAERTCAVPRNDPRKQAIQPTPRQVEWAVDQAVIGALDQHISRPSNWKGTGMAAYQPQSLFPIDTLEGDPDGVVDQSDQWYIPSQIMLGVTAQESNMWQATRYAVPGVSANPLIGNYYGVSYASNGDQGDPWAINWGQADCGYGIAQVTDGMRVPGKEKPGEHALTSTQQEAVALDYTANIAAGVNVLTEKWNQTRNAGMVANDGQPKYLENWFFALWAYNTGFYEPSDAGGNGGRWGVGFTNNPANPLWKANRTPFLDDGWGGNDYSEAAHPQDWPYEEKVLGWAGRPISALFAPNDMEPGYRPAWWNGDSYRFGVKPPESMFCNASNDCDPSMISDDDANEPGRGACQLADKDSPLYLHCWWNQSVAWKDCVVQAACGNAVHRFNATDYPEQPDGQAYPPKCTSGLPAGALIVDDLPAGTQPTGSSTRSCGAVKSAGTFQFQFSGSGGVYPSKIDTHQIGAGYGNHFWFTHTRSDSSDGSRMQVTGIWKLGQPLTWARVSVALPDHGAQTQQATYTVGGTDSTSPARVVPQRVGVNQWVDLGVFRFTGTPQVTLSNRTDDGTGDDDIAWDAVAFTPLPGKPAHSIVAMGDSFASGEGASEGNANYYPETNYKDGSNKATRNACHRSTEAWSRQATLPGQSLSIGQLANVRDADTDFHLIACSGARTYNVLGGPGITADNTHEVAQLEQGFLDQNTTLVTIAIGGNDARFGDVIKKCLVDAGFDSCGSKTFDSRDLKIGDRDKSYQGMPTSEALPKLIEDVVRPDIVKTLEAVHVKAPNAYIVLMGYPPLISDNGNCLRVGVLGGGVGMTAASAVWLNDVAQVLTTEMQAAVTTLNGEGVDAWFTDPAEAFAGKGVCGSPESIHGVVKTLTTSDDPIVDKWMLKGIPYGLSAQSFHPTIAGARLYADALEATFSVMPF